MTPHRMLYEALTTLEYKQFCRNFDPAYDMEDFLESTTASEALNWGFWWLDSNEGRDYWLAVYARLDSDEQQRVRI